MRFPLAAAALVLSATMAMAADPVGSYRVEGTNPGSTSHYSGTARVEKTGDTYRVVWVVACTRYIGTGIGDDKFIAFSYRFGRDTGLALYKAEGDDREGVWA